MSNTPIREEFESRLRELAAIERPSASPGERQAAERIAEWLRAEGLDVAIETERAHGGYWWPLGLANGAALLASRRRPVLAAAVAASAAAAVWDECGGGRLWLRRLLARRDTYNVLARGGDPDAERTIVFVAHHDAAHSGQVFNPALPRAVARAFPEQTANAERATPILYAVWLGPAMLTLAALLDHGGLRRLGRLFAAGSALAMADIGRSAVVPGANDNLSAVIVLLALARRLPRDMRVLLLSTGSEESFMEGMRGFMDRHAGELDPRRTDIVCLECLGGPDLHLLEGEGMLQMRDYSEALRAEIAAAARRAGVGLRRRYRTVAATDALVAVRRGYRAATLASVDVTMLPSNYHWPTDTPENLHWPTIERALAVCEALLYA